MDSHVLTVNEQTAFLILYKVIFYQLVKKMRPRTPGLTGKFSFWKLYWKVVFVKICHKGKWLRLKEEPFVPAFAILAWEKS